MSERSALAEELLAATEALLVALPGDPEVLGAALERRGRAVERLAE